MQADFTVTTTNGVTMVTDQNLADGFEGTDTVRNVELLQFDDGSMALNNLVGDAGANDLVGTASADHIFGLAGDDTLAGGAGDDTLDGGAGTDLASYQNDPTGVTASLATGTVTDGFGNTDTLVGIENLRGSNFGDRLTGDAGANLIEGGDGNDRLIGNAGDDTLDGGARFDVVSYRGSGASVNVDLATGVAQDGEGGTDTLTNIEGIDGSDFDDTLTGGNPEFDNFESFNPGDGVDVIAGGSGFDRIGYFDSPGAVTVDLRTGVALDGYGNTDTFTGIEDIWGSDFDDTLTGGFDDDGERFEGGGGNDIIDGGSGLDQVRYSRSDNPVNVNLATGVAQDGEGGTDTLRNIEAIRGSGFDDTLTGGFDDDFERFEGGGGNDIIDGGSGFDEVRYSRSDNPVNVNLATGVAQDGEGGTDTLRNIEGIWGSDGDDTLTGGFDDGFELFDGGGGNDIIDGGSGFDEARYSRSDNPVNVNLATGVAQDGEGGTDTLSNIEGIRGSDFDDTLTGGFDDDFEQFEGGGGNDIIDGGSGFDEARYSRSDNPVNVDLATGVAQDGEGGTDTLSNIEAIRGSGWRRYADGRFRR